MPGLPCDHDDGAECGEQAEDNDHVAVRCAHCVGGDQSQDMTSPHSEDNTPLMSHYLLAVMVFNVALKPSGAISNSRLLISIALKSRGNLCGYSNEHAATVRSCSQRLRKQRFLST